MSVPQRRKYSLEVSAMIDQEIADEESESIEGSTEEE